MNDTVTTPDYLGHRQRLKKRFLKSDSRAFPDYELLELLLMLAIPRRDVKPMAKELLRRFGSFAKVIHAPQEELCKVAGVKDSAYTVFQMVVAACERCSWESLRESELPVFMSSEALIDFCRTAISFSDVEELHLIHLNSKSQVIRHELMQRGTIDAVYIHPREVVKAALNNQSASIILVHNHPSGDVTPSHADIQITRRVKESCEAVDVKVSDHIIISPSDAYSFREHNLVFSDSVSRKRR